MLGELNILGVVATNAVVSGALLLLLRPASAADRLFPSQRAVAAFARAYPVVTALAVVAVLAIAWRVVLALVLPPYGYDALHYHLPTVIGWIQSHRVSTSPLNTCCAYYPENGELLATWPAVLGGGVEYIDLVQIAAALVGAAAVAGLARVARLPREGAVAAASLFLLTPILLEQSNTADVDVTFTATALATYFLLLRALGAARPPPLVSLRRSGNGRRPLPRHEADRQRVLRDAGRTARGRRAAPPAVEAAGNWLAAAVFAVPVAVLGISWYVRSWLARAARTTDGGPDRRRDRVPGNDHLTGAPPGLRRYFAPLQPIVSWASDLHFWTKMGYTLGGLATGGLGPVWAYFGAILSVVFAVYAWRRCRPVFWFFLVPTALLFAVQPDHWYSRYTIAIAAVGAIGVAWAMTADWRPSQARLAFGVAALVLAGAGAWISSRVLIPTAGFRVLGPRTVIRDALDGKRTVGTAFDPGYHWIDGIHGQPIAVDPYSARMFAPLAGRSFQNRLVALPRVTDLRAFVASHHVAYVAAFKDSYYDLQARKDPGVFQLIGGDRLRGYRVRR